MLKQMVSGKKVVDLAVSQAEVRVWPYGSVSVLLPLIFCGGLLAQIRNERSVEKPADPGCEDAVLVSTGGSFPKASKTLAIRWTGYSNFELAYDGEVILLDAYFDRGSEYPPLGFKAADIKIADVILIGHGHFDHMADAASVAARTGAVVVGAPLTTEKLMAQNVDGQHIRTVTGKGDEILEFRGFKIEPILGRHGQPPPSVTGPIDKALRSVTTPPTDDQAAESAAIRQRGVSDPRLITEGTITYLITFDNGFRLAYRDSGGAITDYETAAMKRVGRVDVALMATEASYLPALTTKRALEYMRTYKPDIFIPAHHDASYNGLWRATEPIFQALKDENPSIITISKTYREPICLETDNNISRRSPGSRARLP